VIIRKRPQPVGTIDYDLDSFSSAKKISEDEHVH
ncbi:hypothetical protein MNBD_IGNAVI01-1612, partial [hydrothermal vent metagenome]